MSESPMSESREWSEFLDDYDLPPFEGEVRTYLMATTQRTGSHYLADLLARTGAVGVPFEYLNGHRARLEFQVRGWRYEESAHADLYREMVRRRTGTSGWFGIKAHWHTWVEMSDLPGGRDLVRPERFLYLTRRDRVAQAASLAIAERTGVWVNAGKVPARPPVYSAAHIRDAMIRIEHECAGWEGYFASQEAAVCRLTYEDLIADPDGCVEAVFGHLGVTRPSGPPRALPTMDPRTDDLVRMWAGRYRDEVMSAGIPGGAGPRAGSEQSGGDGDGASGSDAGQA